MTGEEEAAANAARALEGDVQSPSRPRASELELLGPFSRGLVLLLREFSDLVMGVMKNAVTLFLAVLAGVTPLLLFYYERPQEESQREREHLERMEILERLEQAIDKEEEQEVIEYRQ